MPRARMPVASTIRSRSRSHRFCRVAAWLSNHFDRTSTTGARPLTSNEPRGWNQTSTSPGCTSCDRSWPRCYGVRDRNVVPGGLVPVRRAAATGRAAPDAHRPSRPYARDRRDHPCEDHPAAPRRRRRRPRRRGAPSQLVRFLDIVSLSLRTGRRARLVTVSRPDEPRHASSFHCCRCDRRCRVCSCAVVRRRGGARDLYPTDRACTATTTGAFRTNLEWRTGTYGPADSAILRRTIWLFIPAPLIGGAIAAFIAPLFETTAGVEEAIGFDDVAPTGANVPD